MQAKVALPPVVAAADPIQSSWCDQVACRSTRHSDCSATGRSPVKAFCGYTFAIPFRFVCMELRNFSLVIENHRYLQEHQVKKSG